MPTYYHLGECEVKNKYLTLGALSLALLSAGPAGAQYVCNYVGGTRVCSDASSGYSSSATPLGGGTTIIKNSDGSSSTINRLDGTTIIKNSDGSSTRVNRLDGSTLIRNSDGSRSTITPLGGGTVIRNSNGSSSTIVPLGGGTVVRNSDGSSSTINNLGNPGLRGSGPAQPCNQFGMTVTCD